MLKRLIFGKNNVITILYVLEDMFIEVKFSALLRVNCNTIHAD